MTTPQENGRPNAYPIVVQHPLRLFMTTSESMIPRARKIVKKISEDVPNQIGIDAKVAIFEITPANERSPQHGNLETYDYVVIGIMIANPTREILDDYAAKLERFYSQRENMPFDNPDKSDWLPLPDVFVPEKEWILNMQTKLNQRATATRGMTNSDGTLNQEFMKEADKKYREANPPTAVSSSTSSVTSPGSNDSAVDDILASGEDPASFF